MSHIEEQADRDNRALTNIYERNKARIREIDAILSEFQPMFSRLMNEREQCMGIVNRTVPPNGVGRNLYGEPTQKCETAQPTAGPEPSC